MSLLGFLLSSRFSELDSCPIVLFNDRDWQTVCLSKLCLGVGSTGPGESSKTLANAIESLIFWEFDYQYASCLFPGSSKKLPI